VDKSPYEIVCRIKARKIIQTSSVWERKEQDGEPCTKRQPQILHINITRTQTYRESWSRHRTRKYRSQILWDSIYSRKLACLLMLYRLVTQCDNVGLTSRLTSQSIFFLRFPERIDFVDMAKKRVGRNSSRIEQSRYAKQSHLTGSTWVLLCSTSPWNKRHHYTHIDELNREKEYHSVSFFYLFFYIIVSLYCKFRIDNIIFCHA